MKKTAKVVLSMLVALQVIALAACGGKVKENPEDAVLSKYVGRWNCTKIVTAENTVDFKKLSSLVNMEMYIEFSEEKTYVVHYYVNGTEGKEYPQTGTFTVDAEQEVLLLTGDLVGTASIYMETGLQYSNNNGVTQYYEKEIVVENEDVAA